jgi:hypothetical protein
MAGAMDTAREGRDATSLSARRCSCAMVRGAGKRRARARRQGALEPTRATSMNAGPRSSRGQPAEWGPNKHHYTQGTPLHGANDRGSKRGLKAPPAY